VSGFERSGWRDQGISEWHRTLGENCPATDLDTIVNSEGMTDDSEMFCMIEYDRHQPKAIIDYKHSRARLDLDQSSVKAQANLATMANIPSFVVMYKSDRTLFRIYPTNDIARNAVQKTGFPLSESDFVRFLYALRKRTAPEYILNKLTNIQPQSLN
jgi:hypothetical protein